MNIDIERVRAHMETLATFTRTPGSGNTRMSYSPEYRQACEHVMDHARGLGLDARFDATGSVRLRLAGMDARAPVLVLGSHLDSVPNGGDFDGVLGVVCGLEVVETLVRAGHRPRHPVEVIAFVEEEGATFRCPLAGSQILTGAIEHSAMERLEDDGGISMAAAAREFGVDTTDLEADRLRPENVRAMLELHIEQGRVLETEQLPVGIVDHIAGSENHRIRLSGRADHAGTTPMPLRRDALAAAAEIILAAEEIACGRERPDTVATVGRVLCAPNAANVVPGAVELSLDVRDVDAACLDQAAAAALDAAAAIAARRRIECCPERTARSEPAACAPGLTALLERLARERGIPHRRMASGALHDAAAFTGITQTAIIFVPSIDGASHVPAERTDYADIRQGAELLLAAVVALA